MPARNTKQRRYVRIEINAAQACADLLNLWQSRVRTSNNQAHLRLADEIACASACLTHAIDAKRRKDQLKPPVPTRPKKAPTLPAARGEALKALEADLANWDRPPQWVLQGN